ARVVSLNYGSLDALISGGELRGSNPAACPTLTRDTARIPPCTFIHAGAERGGPACRAKSCNPCIAGRHPGHAPIASRLQRRPGGPQGWPSRPSTAASSSVVAAWPSPLASLDTRPPFALRRQAKARVASLDYGSAVPLSP